MSSERTKNRNDIYGYNPKTRKLLYSSSVFIRFVLFFVVMAFVLFLRIDLNVAVFIVATSLVLLIGITELAVARAKARVVVFDQSTKIVRIVSFWYPTHFLDLKFYRTVDVPFSEIMEVEKIFFTRYRTERVLTQSSRFYLDSRTDRLDHCIERLHQIAVKNTVQTGQQPRAVLSMTAILFIAAAVVVVCAAIYMFVII